MPDGVFVYGLQGCLAIALLVAAFTDLRRRQIDNWLTGAVAISAPLFWWATGLTFGGIGWQLALTLGTFFVTAAIFARGGMGGGDVKLLVALALWVGVSLYVIGLLNGLTPVSPAALAQALAPGWLGTALVGAAVVAAFAILVVGAAVISRNQRAKLPIPYGLAISVAGLWILAPTLLTHGLG